MARRGLSRWAAPAGIVRKLRGCQQPGLDDQLCRDSLVGRIGHFQRPAVGIAARRAAAAFARSRTEPLFERHVGNPQTIRFKRRLGEIRGAQLRCFEAHINSKDAQCLAQICSRLPNGLLGSAAARACLAMFVHQSLPTDRQGFLHGGIPIGSGRAWRPIRRG